MTTKARLDQFLVQNGFFDSREQAQRAIMAGEVKVGTRVAAKPSELVLPDAEVHIAERPKFVGRGGLKLEGALNQFQIDPIGKVALDIGASTGGFTDCLLQRGAAKVYAVDVGHDQLAWKIRNDPRVVVVERVNARELAREHVPEDVDLAVIDVSFISLTLILPKAFQFLKPTGLVIALIKPQFELAKEDVARGGIVREPALHQRAQEKIRSFVETAGHDVVDLAPSTITGTDGNQEFFICARKRSA
jgi:23S rRNA (cytidine1920-2'-O)/16S rRNA (cytidine1409-2'-O)-methyltransferase